MQPGSPDPFRPGAAVPSLAPRANSTPRARPARAMAFQFIRCSAFSTAPASMPKCFGSIHDARSQEDHELASRVRRAPALEQKSEKRDVAEERDLIEVSAGVASVD